MKKVITYGTYDLLHHGHVRLLERAKALGDYLIVGVTSDDFDKRRGKINNKQTLEERIAAVQSTGLADKIIVEEYEGQKIDDIKKYGVDIFTVGSDWVGHFDYLNEFCKVIYLPRTEGISSSEKRDKLQQLKIGIIGPAGNLVDKFIEECKYVNGVKLTGRCGAIPGPSDNGSEPPIVKSVEELLDVSDAVYIASNPKEHYAQIKAALTKGKNVLCETPITVDEAQTKELFELAAKQSCVLQEGMKTAYATAYERMMLLLKSNVIGEIVSVSATCTSLSINPNEGWSGVTYWVPTALLPGLQIFGTNYISSTKVVKKSTKGNDFACIHLIYPHGIVTANAGCGVKSEGELIISGTKGYIYVPAPWWKTDYFEIRFENPADNRKYFYQLDGEGIRYEIVNFLHSANGMSQNIFIEKEISVAISKIMKEIDASENTIYLDSDDE